MLKLFQLHSPAINYSTFWIPIEYAIKHLFSFTVPNTLAPLMYSSISHFILLFYFIFILLWEFHAWELHLYQFHYFPTPCNSSISFSTFSQIIDLFSITVCYSVCWINLAWLQCLCVQDWTGMGSVFSRNECPPHVKFLYWIHWTFSVCLRKFIISIRHTTQ